METFLKTYQEAQKEYKEARYNCSFEELFYFRLSEILGLII